MAFAMPTKPKENEAQSKGAAFLTQSKESFASLFDDLTLQADEFASLEDFVEELCRQAWELTESLCKASYKNGLGKRRSRQG